LIRATTNPRKTKRDGDGGKAQEAFRMRMRHECLAMARAIEESLEPKQEQVA
jgi:predicted RNase H-like nuclease (RuvC/YqgF family)